MQVQAASPSAPTLHSRPARHTIILHSSISIHHAKHTNTYLPIHNCMKLSVKRLNGLTLCTFAQAQLQCIFLFKPEKTNNLSSSKKKQQALLISI